MVTDRPIFVLAGNGSYLNRGCEAIVRGTTRILKNAFDNPLFINANFDFSRNPYVSAEEEKDLVHRPITMKRWFPKWIAKHILERVSATLNETFTYHQIKNDIIASKAVLSIGGDNYSLDYGIPIDFLGVDNYVTRLKKPLIIWGASIGPFEKTPKLAKLIFDHFRAKVAAFFVREDLSYEYLLRNGISQNVVSMADPGFVMEAHSVSEDRIGFSLPAGAIGLNLSPLMARYVTSGDPKAWLLKSADILGHLKRKFGSPIVLIPHDTRPHINDHKFMSEVLKQLGADSTDIYLLPDNLTAAQTKWIISRMKCMVAAKTHATIAAFSSYVPAVSLGYSIKSEGINRQVFGHTEFLISSENFDKDRIANTLRDILNSVDDIREHLKNKMLQIQKKALNAGLVLKQILEKF